MCVGVWVDSGSPSAWVHSSVGADGKALAPRKMESRHTRGASHKAATRAWYDAQRRNVCWHRKKATGPINLEAEWESLGGRLSTRRTSLEKQTPGSERHGPSLRGPGLDAEGSNPPARLTVGAWNNVCATALILSPKRPCLTKSEVVSSKLKPISEATSSPAPPVSPKVKHGGDR